MSAKVLLLAVAQGGLFFLVGRVVVDIVLGWVARPEEARRRIGAPEKWLLACLGFVLWSTLMMLGHVATSGRTFSGSWIVPVATVLLLMARFLPRFTRGRSIDARLPSLRTLLVLLAAGGILIALYALPAIRGGSSLRTGDAPWHLGWTEQILGGEPLPEGPAPRFAANAYPWGLHAIYATLVRLVPGSNPLIAHEALHLVLIGAIPLAAACLARLVNRRAGWTAAAAASLIGGFGWVEARAPDFVASPGEARYGADLVAASPNSLYELLPPALPRELGLVLLGAAAVLLAVALRERAIAPSIAAGIAIGSVGLVSVPMLLSATLWFAAAVLAYRAFDRRAVVMVGTAIITFGLWAAPVAVGYIRYGGFVNVSPRLGVEWTIGTALASWGLLLPLAIAGFVLIRLQPPSVVRDLTAFCAAAILLIALALARGAFDWGVLGNETLLHQGRFWPPAHLLASALAGIALVGLVGKSRRAGPVVVALILAIGAISPALGSIDLTRTIRDRKDGFLYGSAELQENAFVRRAATYLDPGDVIRAENDEGLLSFYLFQFSGVRIAANEQTDPADNPWRIRFEELARRWRNYEETTGFTVDYVLTTTGPDPGTFVEGDFRGEHWEMFSTAD